MYKLGPGAPAELAGGEDIKFEEPAYSMGAGAQGDFDSPVLRLRYSSLSTPSSTIDYNMQTGQRCPLSSASAAAGLCLLSALSLMVCTPRRVPLFCVMRWLSQTLCFVSKTWHWQCLGLNAVCYSPCQICSL